MPSVGVTMSIHKLTAGSGYDYLTRQVAALDATHKGHVGLASYYTARGEAPGSWTGAGLAGIDGLTAGDPVTAEQMKALFGLGLHPLAAQRLAQLQGPDLTDADYQAVTRLGAPFKVFDNDISPFRVEVARRIAAVNQVDGLPGDWPVPAAIRAQIRTEVATEYFRAEHGRDPDGPRELAGIIAKLSRPRTDAVAGYDLTFSPVKSVSTLWAVADPTIAAAIERAHQKAVADALRFVESHALFTRTGANGVRQVNVQGLVAAAFTHRDSRAGDPDLHTHVAVANKVQTLDGRWLSIDGRVLFKANVAASETYNTALETHLRDSLGVRFAERPNPDPRKRPVREIVGVDPALNQRWSSRRVSIDARRGELAAEFQHRHGRPPTPVEMLRLAQQATLETRDAKHEPRSLAEQRHTWHQQAVEVLGGAGSGPAHGQPDARSPTEEGVSGRRGLAGSGRRSGCGGGGGTPRDLAGMACPGRSPTPGPGRRRSRGPGGGAGRPARRPGPPAPVRAPELARPTASPNPRCCAAPTGPPCTRSPGPTCTRRPGSWPPNNASSPPLAAPAGGSSTMRRSRWRCWRWSPTVSR